MSHARDLILAVTFLYQEEKDLLVARVKPRRDSYEKDGICKDSQNIFTEFFDTNTDKQIDNTSKLVSEDAVNSSCEQELESKTEAERKDSESEENFENGNLSFEYESRLKEIQKMIDMDLNNSFDDDTDFTDLIDQQNGREDILDNVENDKKSPNEPTLSESQESSVSREDKGQVSENTCKESENAYFPKKEAEKYITMIQPGLNKNVSEKVSDEALLQQSKEDQTDEIMCKLCYSGFSTRRNLKQHEKTIHKDDQKELALKDFSVLDLAFPCDLCPLQFLSANILATHKRLNHRTAKRTTGATDSNLLTESCVHCPFKFSSHGALRRHSSKAHGKIIPRDHSKFKHSCLLCYRRFEKPSEVKIHQRKAHIEKDLETLRGITSNDQLKHSCTECENKFLTEEILNYHIKFHKLPGGKTTHPKITDKTSASSLSKCNYCPREFPSSKSLRKHSWKVHNKKVSVVEDKSKYSFKCQLCYLPFKYTSVMEKHQNKVHSKEDLALLNQSISDDQLKYPCNHCGKKFLSQNILSYHMRTHPDVQKCMLCRVTFYGSAKLESHKKIFHGNEIEAFEDKGDLNYSCNSCSEKFMTKNSVMYHSKVVHKSKETYCKLCRLNFKTNTGLFSHKRTIHISELEAFDIKYEEIDLKHNCSFCHKKFATEPSLNHHVKRHKSTTTMNIKSEHFNRCCQLCDIKYKKPVFLKRHKVKIHSNELDAFEREILQEELVHECNICSKRFFSEQTLQFHERKTHKLRKYGVNNFCKLCQTSFTGLATHVKKIHTSAEEKQALKDHEKTIPFNFLCKYCDKYFLNSIILNRHIVNNHKQEDKEEQWKCEKCPKVFKAGKYRNGNFKKHMKNVHEAEKSTKKKPRVASAMTNYFKLLDSLRF